MLVPSEFKGLAYQQVVEEFIENTDLTLHDDGT